MLTLSVISTAYNGEEYIGAFLEGIAAQTYHDFEFIIVNDGSTDRTSELIKAYLPRLGRDTIFIQHDKRQGQAVGVLTAFSKSTGDICVNIDADSLIAPDTFANFMESFAADKQTGLVTAPLASMDRSNWILRGAEVVFIAQHRTDLKDANDYSQAFGSCFAFRRCLFPVEDLMTSGSEVDWTWQARKQGWRIVLQENTTIRTRFPSTLSWTFFRGRRLARQVIPTYWHHKEKLLTRWGFWVKFAPLGLLLTAIFKPKWALVGLLGWLGATQIFLARKAPDFPFIDRLAAWGVTVVRWSGFSLEVILMMAQAVANKLAVSK